MEDKFKIKRVACLVCGWSDTDPQKIENANFYGECLSCTEGLLQWEYKEGGMMITNSENDQRVEWGIAETN